MCAELKINGGLIMIGDHCCGKEPGKHDASVTVFYEVAAGQAVPLAQAFEDNGGEIEELPAMKFWGQGNTAWTMQCLIPGVGRTLVCT